MNAAMVRDATDALATADVVLWLVDASEDAGRGEDFILELLGRAGTPVILALNKIDRLASKEQLLPRIAAFASHRSFREIIPISAKTGDGVERLARLLAENLPERASAYPEDFLTSMPETEWIAEVIREKLLERTREELPFASTVLIESIDEEAERDLVRVAASIVVEREGQKGIVIGKGGSMIRDVGTAARQELEAETGRHYFLDLNVKVREDWRNDERFLAQLAADPSVSPSPHGKGKG
jgi:GTP-binding protein Era